MWAYLTRYPGLVVLHDAQLHQSRAKALLGRGRLADLRAEFRFEHPDAPAGVAEWIIAGLGNPGAPIWPFTAVPLAAARAVAVHFPALAEELRDAQPGLDVHVIRHGAPDLRRAASRPNCQGQRPRHSQRPTSKGAGDARRAPWELGVGNALAVGPWRSELRSGRRPDVRRLRPGHAREARAADSARARGRSGRVAPQRPAPPRRATSTPHYDVDADAQAHGVADLVTVTGWVDDDAFDRAIRAADVCLCLRWPTNREASGPWLRALAAGKPTVVNDLAHLVDLPTLDPRTWEVQVAAAAAADANACLAPRRGDRRRHRHPRRGSLAGAGDAPPGARRHAARRARRGGPPSLGRATTPSRTWPPTTSAQSPPRRPPRRQPGRPLPAHVTERSAPALARRLAAEVGVAVDFLSGHDHSTERRPARSRRAAERERAPGAARRSTRAASPSSATSSSSRSAAYDSTVVADGDEIEIVNFVGGG